MQNPMKKKEVIHMILALGYFLLLDPVIDLLTLRMTF